jgi:hypothetical protein
MSRGGEAAANEQLAMSSEQWKILGEGRWLKQRTAVFTLPNPFN